MFKVSAHYVTTGRDCFSSHWQQCQWCCAPDQSRLQQSLFEFINILEGHLVDTVLHDSQTL